MLIPFYTSARRRPWLIGIFAILLVIGLALLLARG